MKKAVNPSGLFLLEGYRITVSGFWRGPV